jgi:hypothetical protein
MSRTYDPYDGSIIPQVEGIRPQFSADRPYHSSEQAPEPPYAGRGPSKILADPLPGADPPTGTPPFIGAKQDIDYGKVGEGSSGVRPQLFLPDD